MPPKGPFHLTPMRLSQLLPALFGAVVITTACSMDATAPSRLAAPQPVASSGNASTERIHDDAAQAGSQTYFVTIDPAHPNRLHFGKHTLSIPADAVCRMDGSGYGLGVFDASCEPETMPVSITATVSADARGLPRIVLGPEVRFSPDKTVELSMWVGSSILATTTTWNIFYCPGTGFENCIDESILDPSLAAQVDVKRGTVSRRIKHFSGYYLVE